MLEAPPISLESKFLSSFLLSQKQPLDFPRPKLYENREIKNITPKPILCFDAIELEKKAISEKTNGTSFLFVQTVVFDYEGVRISADDTLPQPVFEDGDTLIEIKRDFLFEKNARQECALILPTRAPAIEEKLNTNQDLQGMNALVLLSVTSKI